MTVKICAIVAMSENRVIGRDGGLPWTIPEDLKHFKNVTMGKPVIMGRKTFDSIGKPLPGRKNIIVSRSIDASENARPGVFNYSDLENAVKDAKDFAAAENQTEIMIIGGGQIYAQALRFTDRIYLTVVHQTIEGDTFFPVLDDKEWREVSRDDRDGFSFITLDRFKI